MGGEEELVVRVVDGDDGGAVAEEAEEGAEIFRYESSKGGDGGQSEPLLSRRASSNGTSQIALIGSKVCPIESLDYEMLENDIFKQDWRSRKKIQIYQYVFLKWALALLIGLVTALVGFFNNFAIENIAGFKFLLTSNLLNKGRYYMAFVVYAGSNLFLAAAAAILCAYVAPAAAGSGISEVKAYLNGIDAPSILAPTTLLVKIFGSIGGVSAGFLVGKEGPMVHTGACIASLLGQGGSRKYRISWKWLRYFKNDRDRRDLITCGAAAGVAAAFRAPVGGVLFALEEAASWWRNALLWRTFFATAVAAFVLRTFRGYCRNGNCGLFGEGGLIMFDVSSIDLTYEASDVVFIVFLGVLGGLLGALFNYLINKTLRTYSFVNEKGAPFKVLLAMTISIITSCSSYFLPWMASCRKCPVGLEDRCPSVGRSGNYRQFQCPPGHYNDLASLLLNTHDDAIRNLFSGTASEFRLPALIAAFATAFSLGIATYGIAVPSGLFIPVILSGATYGRAFSSLLRSLGVATSLDPGLVSLLGSAAFLGGTMRMTVSVCVILLELTNDLVMLPLVMIVLLVSKTVADGFNKGVYDQIVHMKGFPFMEAHAEPYMRNLVAGDVVVGPLVQFNRVEKVSTVVNALRMTRHNGFPVVDGMELCGVVLRSHLVVLLEGRAFGRTREKAVEVAGRMGAWAFAKKGSGKETKVEEVELSEEDMEMVVDLNPITNASPYTVLETMSLAKAAILFRQLGLRHLCVVPKTPGRPPIVGILTRHDFMPEHIRNLYPEIDRH